MDLFKRVALSGIFLVPGMLHMVDSSQFALQISQYGIVSEFASVKLAPALAFLELWLGCSFLIQRAHSATYFISSMLLFVFAAAVVFAIVGERRITCGCLGIYSPTVSVFHLGVIVPLALLFAGIGARQATVRQIEANRGGVKS